MSSSEPDHPAQVAANAQLEAEQKLVERYEAPSRAPEGSLWSRQQGVDFFLPPAVSQAVLHYLDDGEDDLDEALRSRFGLSA